MSKEYIDILNNAAIKLKINISATQQEKLIKYVDYILEWNEVYNITSIKTKKKILIYHIIDSLAVIPSLKKIYSKNIKLADIGSGCGVPGMILAIMNNDWNIICIDSVEKKTSFIKYVANCLLIKNIKVIHSRVECITPLNCDIVISRAFSSIKNFILLSHKHLNQNGTLIAMKGLFPQHEIEDLKSLQNWNFIGTKNLYVPYLESKRCLIYIKEKNNI
ncbi:Ribosomal RNA small subunit methyltransferase G [Candidatus Kinetoplastibacterium sorsogonicusi]|uniref:Ribosomal RNA small subunit methyltransferase G n=1 Tax=Candidatus Kinetoplastidibacterium kentomonadis TaxID=1576550 RepID=A0A3Q8EXD2_9PROT|nr:16S rRNA (guanine(527)-N(7))-methyltransferase RsmG [Candidatus Kinetoplastibacterium sorsogonicusi]AWD32811.1 Ribosomal RNA small subunit methyltransferase G [Candidatus Kinetoplastibacterium sorsogonicusi]